MGRPRALTKRSSEKRETPRIEPGRADMIDLGQKAAKAMLEHEERERIRQGIEGPDKPVEHNDCWGVVVKKLWSGPAGDWYRGSVIGQLPGSRTETEVHARTVEGVIAMCHRAFLASLTKGNVCPAPKARLRASTATFYVATVE